MRKTPLFGFNLFYHDDPIISAEDIRPSATYTGPLQADPQDTLNYNFKRMDFVLQSFVDGAITFDKFRTTGGHSSLSPGDAGIGGNLWVGGSIFATGSFDLHRTHLATPHYLLDFADVLVNSGFDPNRTVSLTIDGATYTASDKLNPFIPDNSSIQFSGSSVYPIVYTIASSQPLFSIEQSDKAKLLLTFNAIPQGISKVKIEASYDGTNYNLLAQFTDGLSAKSLFFQEVVFTQDPRNIRVTIEGTNSSATNFQLVRLALLHTGTPALENFYLSRRGGQIWGDLTVNNLTATGTINGNVSSAAKWQTARNLTLSGAVTGSAFIDGSADVTLNTSMSSSSITNALGYTPVNKAGDTMTGVLNVPSLNVGNKRLMNVVVNQSSDTTTRYYLLGTVNSNNGFLRVKGILGGHNPPHGRGNINLQVNFYSSQVQIDGYVIGNIAPNADIWVRDLQNGNAEVYLVTKEWALVNLELSCEGVVTLQYNETYTNSLSGTNPIVFKLSDETNNNFNHPYLFVFRNGQSYSNTYHVIKDDIYNWGEIVFQINGHFGSGIKRLWGIGIQSSLSGTASGGNFKIWRYDNNGSYLDWVMEIMRSTGLISINGTLNIYSITGGYYGHINSYTPIKFSNGSNAQEIYIKKARISSSWSVCDANDPGDGGIFVHGTARIVGSLIIPIK